MSDLQALSEQENEDPELVPEILPVDARLLIAGTTADLLRLFQRASALAPQKELIPGTSQALIEAILEPGTSPYLRVSASDNSMWLAIVSDGPIRIKIPGAVLVPAKKMLDVLKQAPGKNTKITVIGNTASVVSGRAQWNIAIGVGERLSSTPQDMDVETFPVTAGALREGLKAVRPAVSTNDARGSLMQAHVALGSITASDGPRLHRWRVRGLSQQVATDIPASTIAHVLAVLEPLPEDEEILLGSSDNRIVFNIGGSTIVSQRLHYQFPDVDALVLGPTFTHEFSLVVGRDDLLTAVKRVRVNADPDRAAIQLSLSPRAAGEGWNLNVSARDRNGNAAQEYVVAQWSDTRAREMTFNHAHLVDLLNSLPDDIAIFRLGPDSKTAHSALFIESEEFTGILTQSMRGDWST